MVISRDIRPSFVPTYCKSFDLLSARQTEVLALHLLRAQAALTAEAKSPTSFPLHQSRSITWLRMLHGKWLLAASSDATTSVLSLWSLQAVLTSPGKSEAPTAEVYLSGPVGGGELFVSGNEVAVALDIQSL